MPHSVAALQSLALSGTKNVDIAVTPGDTALYVRISAEYAAVAGTSGISYVPKVSYDGGSTFTNSLSVSGATVAPAATVIGTSLCVVPIGDNPQTMDTPRRPDHVRIALTNLDGTNAAAIAVTVEQQNYAQ